MEKLLNNVYGKIDKLLIFDPESLFLPYRNDLTHFFKKKNIIFINGGALTSNILEHCIASVENLPLTYAEIKEKLRLRKFDFTREEELVLVKFYALQQGIQMHNLYFPDYSSNLSDPLLEAFTANLKSLNFVKDQTIDIASVVRQAYARDAIRVYTFTDEAGREQRILRGHRDQALTDIMPSIGMAEGFTYNNNDKLYFLPGGNYHLIDDKLNMVEAIVGKNEWHTNAGEYITNRTITLETDLTTKSITHIGLDDWDTYCAGYQPLFHTDLYFCPLGKNKNNKPTFLLLRITHENDFSNVKNDTLFKRLEDGLQKTSDQLRGKFGDDIVIIYADGIKNNSYVFSFCNALVENYKIDKDVIGEVYLPTYYFNDPEQQKSYLLAKSKLKEDLEVNGFNTNFMEFINFNYFTQRKSAGLRCIVNEISRETLKSS